MRSCIMPGLPTHLVQELNVGIVCITHRLLQFIPVSVERFSANNGSSVGRKLLCAPCFRKVQASRIKSRNFVTAFFKGNAFPDGRDWSKAWPLTASLSPLSGFEFHPGHVPRKLPVTWVRRWFSPGTPVSSTCYNWLVMPQQQYGRSDETRNSQSKIDYLGVNVITALMPYPAHLALVPLVKGGKHRKCGI